MWDALRSPLKTAGALTSSPAYFCDSEILTIGIGEYWGMGMGDFIGDCGVGNGDLISDWKIGDGSVPG